MLFMVIERFRPGDAKLIGERLGRSTTRRYIRVLALVFGTLCGTLAWPQHSEQLPPEQQRTAQIRGQIRMLDGHPATLGITVYLRRSTGGMAAQTQTDSVGGFEFQRIPQDAYILTVRVQGYKQIVESVDLTTKSKKTLDLQLRPDPNYEGLGGSVSVESLNAPEGARRDLERGKELLSKGTDLGKSIQLLKKAIAAYPNYSEAYLLMGLAYGHQNKSGDASTALNRAIEINPKYTAAYLALGALDNEQRKFADAEKPLLKAVELNADSADAQLELARAYWGLGRWQDADPHAEKAVELRPDSSDAHLIMGNVLLRKRDGAGALREYKESLRLAPNGPMAEPTRQMVTKLEAVLNNGPERPAK